MMKEGKEGVSDLPLALKQLRARVVLWPQDP